MKHLLFLLAMGCLFQTASAQTPKTEVKPFQLKEGWGYDIFVDGKKYVHQENIPAIQGIHYFRTQQDAKKAGEFVATKIKKNIMPPTVSPEELDSLKVLPVGMKVPPKKSEK